MKNHIVKFLKKHPDDDGRFKALEERFLGNADLAMDKFEKGADGLDALSAAKAANIFATKGLEIKKARTAGFKEPPINVNIIRNLQATLNALTIHSNVEKEKVVTQS